MLPCWETCGIVMQARSYFVEGIKICTLDNGNAGDCGNGYLCNSARKCSLPTQILGSCKLSGRPFCTCLVCCDLFLCQGLLIVLLMKWYMLLLLEVNSVFLCFICLDLVLLQLTVPMTWCAAATISAGSPCGKAPPARQ